MISVVGHLLNLSDVRGRGVHRNVARRARRVVFKLSMEKDGS